MGRVRPEDGEGEEVTGPMIMIMQRESQQASMRERK